MIWNTYYKKEYFQKFKKPNFGGKFKFKYNLNSKTTSHININKNKFISSTYWNDNCLQLVSNSYNKTKKNKLKLKTGASQGHSSSQYMTNNKFNAFTMFNNKPEPEQKKEYYFSNMCYCDQNSVKFNRNSKKYDIFIIWMELQNQKVLDVVGFIRY